MDFGLAGERNPGWTGVWVRHPQSGQLLKIASIGVAVKSWVTYHGIGLNVSTDLGYFRQINPCGLEAQVMTRLVDLLDTPPTMDVVKIHLHATCQKVFVQEKANPP